MSGRIVVGIDGSEQSGKALEWAVARARLGGNELELVNAYSITTELDFYGFRGIPVHESMEWIVDFSQQVLDAAESRVRELAPDLTSTLTSKVGHPAYVLAEVSEDADVLVVGRRGLGGAASVLLGSVSNRLAIHGHCPLVVVGEEEFPTDGPIVVGVDESEFGANALRFAIAEAALRGTSVRAVFAYDASHPAILADPELVARLQADLEAHAAETTTRVLAEVKRTGAEQVNVEHVAVEGRAAEAILRHAEDAQLIVVGSHGKGLVRRMLLGSVSRQVLHDAERPVAVVDLPDD